MAVIPERHAESEKERGPLFRTAHSIHEEYIMGRKRKKRVKNQWRKRFWKKSGKVGEKISQTARG